MSDDKRKRIELETTAKGDRFWLNDTRKKRMLAILGDLPLIIKHAEHGPLKLAAENAMEQITCVAIFYGLLAPETVSDDAEPASPEDKLHDDAGKAANGQTVVGGGK